MTDLRGEPIAIIGLSCRLPGADNIDQFWSLLCAGHNAIGEVPAERWSIDDFYDPRPATPGKMVTRWGGFLTDIDAFEPAFFGISPREAERMDPQQRLTLELAWEALENAGVAPGSLKGTGTGVFLGIGNHDYTRELCADLGAIASHNGIGGTLSIAANRVSYLLDLRGPSLGIESACSSSLIAMHLACQSLRQGEVSMALVGGVNAVLTPDMTIAFSQARMMSPTGACRAFDADADGYVRSEGGAMLVLKPYAAALRAGDRIDALIRGSAINQDGTTNGITAPSGRAQREVIEAACQAAGIVPAALGYVEAHGTGTLVGDPIEFNALRAVLLPQRQPGDCCFVGAVKTNIGHLEAAAGIAGVVKTVLALQHKVVPPNLHLRTLNPSIKPAPGKLSLPARCEPWKPIGNTRLAGVSAFSFGGSNCHVILEQAPALTVPVCDSDRVEGGEAVLLTFSARDERALKDLVSRHIDYLRREPMASLKDIGYTLGKGRNHWPHRLAIVADSKAVLRERLEAWRDGRVHSDVFYQLIKSRRAPKAEFAGVGACGDREPSLVDIARLYTGGVAPDWRKLYGASAAPVPLPTYPFQRQRYWHRPRRVAAGARIGQIQAGEIKVGEIQAGQIQAAPGAADTQNVQDIAAAVRSGRVDIHAILREQLAATLHMDSGRINGDTPFLELGADSLVLVEFTHKLETWFGVKITMRQLFDELTSVDLLTAYLRAQGQAQGGAVIGPRAAARECAPGASEKLAGGDTGATSIRPPPPPQTLISNRQQLYLEQFIPAYCQRTAGSKARAQAARMTMADSRASAGFRPSIKEMLYPIIGDRGEGAYFWDIDNNRYLDISMGFGVLLLGHQPECVVTALQGQLHKGLFIGPQAPLAEEVAGLICQLTGVERVAFCNSGTEAVMTALRLARTATGKDKIVIFANAYHGHFDGVLANSQGNPGCAGIAPDMVNSIHVLAYDDPASLHFIRRHGNELAAVLVEPVQSRYPGRQPAEFLQQLRALTEQLGILLIFDEVLTGFRIHPGGAQAWFDIRADLVTYGKIVGGGLPIGIVAGRSRLLAGIDGGYWRYGDDSVPGAATTFFAGTFNKNHLGMAAARAVLQHLREQGPQLQEALNRTTQAMVKELNQLFVNEQVPLSVAHFGSLFRFQFSGNMDLFFYHLLKKGVYIWEGRTCFLSTAHMPADISFLIQCVGETIDEMKRGGWFTDTGSIAVAPKAGGEIDNALPSPLTEGSLTASAGRARLSLHAHPAEMRRYVEGMERLNRLALIYIRCALRDCGSESGLRAPVDEWMESISISPDHRQLVQRFTTWLSEAGAADVYAQTQTADADALAQDIARDFPQLAPEFEIVNRCGPALSDVITGRRHPISVLFPNGDLQALTRVYADSVLSRTMNRLIRTALIDLIEQLPDHGPVRILELGAGTGGTTNCLLPALQQLERANISYTFSDISEHFITQARQRYRDYDFIDYRLLDIENAPADAHYDIVIAANVLHATRDIARTLATTKQWLAPGGVLLLLEITRAAPWLDLVFGITAGWWRFADRQLRTACPLLEQARWLHCLRESGFDPVRALGSDAQVTGLPPGARAQQTLFIARAPLALALSENQRGMLTVSRMSESASRAYNLNIHLEFKGDLNLPALEKAVGDLYRRHQALRIVFHQTGEWQRVKAVEAFGLDLPCLETSEGEAEQWLSQWGETVFDLSRGPLVVFRLLRLDLRRHWLVLTAHHLVMDGQSVATLAEQLMRTYRAYTQKGEAITGREQTRAQQFSDYLIDQGRQCDSRFIELERYWLSALPQPIPVVELPADHKRPSVQSYKGKRVRQFLPDGLMVGLKQVAASEGCTLFMTLLAAFELLIVRLTNRAVGLVGISSAGQNAAGDAKIIGSCVNVLALPFFIEPEMRLVEVLTDVKTRLLDAYAHQDYPFSRLVKKLGLQRNPARAALIDVHFNYDKSEKLPPLDGLTVNMDSYLAGTVRRDITWNIVEIDNQLQVICDYSSDLFDEQTIVEWIAKYERILVSLQQDSRTSVAELISRCQKTEREQTEKRHHHMKQIAANRLRQIKRRERHIDK